MRHNVRKANQRFMYGVMAMALLVLLVAALFLYMCIQK
jgi:hypothetical protein